MALIQDKEECVRLGSFAYMDKPVGIDELSATIKAANDKVQGKQQSKGKMRYAQNNKSQGTAGGR